MEGALTLSWRDMGRTAGILCAASLVGLLIYKAGITEANIVTVYLLAVLCTALATDGRVYGISAAVASVLVFNYLFTVPRFTLKFNDVSRYSVTFLVMFIAACITSTLTMRVKTQARQAARKAHRSEVLLETSQRSSARRENSRYSPRRQSIFPACCVRAFHCIRCGTARCSLLWFATRRDGGRALYNGTGAACRPDRAALRRPGGGPYGRLPGCGMPVSGRGCVCSAAGRGGGCPAEGTHSG
ncbi:MAG: DUF4118 domain-containing protein [Ruthenibacterium lactatiformans]